MSEEKMIDFICIQPSIKENRKEWEDILLEGIESLGFVVDKKLCSCVIPIIKTSVADEGTQCYMCGTCNKPIPDEKIK